MNAEFESALSSGKGRKPNQRMKHFLVLQYLLEKTDENHFVTGEEIAEYLKESCEIYAERRSIYKDIREINIAYVMVQEGVTYEEAVEALEEDPSLETVRYKKKNGYHVVRRPLALEDAKLLAECVHTARFVTERETKYVVEGIGSFLSQHQRTEIRHDSFAVARVKTNNAQVFGIVDTIHEAMAQVKDGRAHVPEKIRFQYLKCTIQDVGKQVERRRGEDYVVSPHAIMISEGNYYLLGIDDKSKKKALKTYRIDRMRRVKLTGEPRESNAGTDNLKEYLATYPQRVFSMYGGRRELVQIRFVNTLLDTVVDRFGDYATYRRDDEKHFVVSVSVEISATFFGWLCGFGNRAKLLSPSPVIEEFTQHLAKMQELYQ